MSKDSNQLVEFEDNFQKYAYAKAVCVRERLVHKDALVTFVIPTYNDSEGLLARAVDSILNQEGFEDYNVLIVGNAHKNNEELSSLLNRQGGDRISYYENEENIGQCGNWNRCLELSRAEYTVMLHDDDYIMPNYLKEVMQIIKMRPNAGLIVTNRIGEHKINLMKAKLPFERFQLLDLFPANQLCAPTGTLFRTEYAKQIGGWNEDILYWDARFNARFLVRYPVYVTPLELTYYRYDVKRYDKDLCINLSEGEYRLFLQSMLYANIPSTIAKIVALDRLKEKMRYYTLSPDEVPILMTNYSERATLWAKRYLKYVCKFRHFWINIIDKL